MKKVLGHHKSAANKGCSTVGFSKTDKKNKKYSKDPLPKKITNIDNITKLDQCPFQD